ncbi:MAG: hypothetical protein KIT69_02765 [Propionibacteriaceae bacterium]|nr:hypothetical protein [Propionibacteriaceae bacterium]
MSGPNGYYDKYNKINSNTNTACFYSDGKFKKGKCFNITDGQKIHFGDDIGKDSLSSMFLPPNYTVKLTNNDLYPNSLVNLVGSKYNDTIACGNWDDNGNTRMYVPKYNDKFNNVKFDRCDDSDTFRFKCCTNADPTRYQPSAVTGQGVCGPLTPSNTGMCDVVVQSYCKKNPTALQCRCFNPQISPAIQKSLEQSGQAQMAWAFDKECTSNTKVYHPSFWRGNMTISLTNCNQIINITDNKNLLMTDTSFNQYCGNAMTEYQKQLITDLGNVLKNSGVDLYTDLTSDEALQYNSCIKQINDKADSSCIPTIKTMLDKAKLRKDTIIANINKLNQLPTAYGITQSDYQGTGPYSMNAFSDCRNISIPKGDFQCLTDFENYFIKTKNDKIEAQKQADLAKKQQEAIISANITKLNQLPTTYGITQSDYQSTGPYSLSAFSTCRDSSIPSGNFQCLTDFENYFIQTKNKKIEAQKQADLLKQQQQTANSIYNNNNLGTQPSTTTTTTPTSSSTPTNTVPISIPTTQSPTIGGDDIPDYTPDPISTNTPITSTTILDALGGNTNTSIPQPTSTSSTSYPTQLPYPTTSSPTTSSSTTSSSTTPSSTTPIQQPIYQPQTTSNNNIYIIIGVLLIILIVIFVIGFYMMRSKSKTGGKSTFSF